MAGDGKQHRTAWAGAGDGVLVRDAGNDGIIDQKNEIDFTGWDVTAKTDLEAIKNIFDTDHDGQLDSGDADWALFKVLVTNEDGTTTLKTLAELDIVSIGLTSNNQEVVYSDGSRLSGTVIFTRSDSSTGIVGDAKLAYDPAGYVVAETVTNNGDGSTTVENVASRTDGSIASRTVSTTSADGLSRTLTFDDDGDGIDDRVVTTETVVNVDDSTTKTIENYEGSGTILLNREVTETSADGLTVTVSTDFDGSGSDDRVETRVKGGDGSLTVTVTALNDDESTRSETTTVTSADGHSRTVETDLDGDSVIDATRTLAVSIDGSGNRTETAIDYAGDDTQTANRIAQTVTVTSADGADRTVTSDLDGDGDTDVTTVSEILRNVDDSTTTTTSRYNGNASLRDVTITDLSADGYSKVTQSDLDGDETIDVTTSDVTVFNVDGSTTQTVETIYANSATASKTVTTWSEDGKTRVTTIDSDGDGEVDRVQQVEIISTQSVQTDSVYSPDGTELIAETVTTTSADGLTQTSLVDADGDGDDDRTVVTTKVINGDGSSTTAVVTKNGSGSVQIGKSVVVVSADGLSVTTSTYLGTNALPSEKTTDVLVLNGDGSTTATVTRFAGTDQEQIGYAVTEISADKLTQTVSTYMGDREDPMSVSTTVTSANGARTTTTTTYSPNGAWFLGETVTFVSADGLTTTTTIDLDGDEASDATRVDDTSLNTDGSTTVTSTDYAGTGTTHKIGQTVVDQSANGLTTTAQSDLDGDGDFDAKTVQVTTLNANGSTTQTETSYKGSSVVQVGKTVTTISDDGLTTTVASHVGAETTAARTTVDETVLESNGSSERTSSTYSADTSLIHRAVTVASGDGLTSTVAVDLDGDGNDDQTMSTSVDGDGTAVTVVAVLDALGNPASTFTRTVSANGLETTTETDFDGDDVVDETSVSETVLNANGSQVQTLSRYRADTSLIERTTIETSADGLSITSTWDGEGTGSASRTQTDVTTLNADGSTTRVISNFVGTSSLNDRTTIETSADGQEVITAVDIDGDDVVDQTIMQEIDGDSPIETSSMDGPIVNDVGSHSGRYSEASADGLSVETDFDIDGDGRADTRFSSETELQTDGSRTTWQTNSSLTWQTQEGEGLVETVTVEDGALVTTSANGLTNSVQYDLDWSGTFDASRTDVTVLNADGSDTQTTSFFEGANLVSRSAVITSADGLTTTLQRDATGTGSFTEISETEIESNADGSVTETTTNETSGEDLISRFVVETSADGRTVTIQRDPNGTGSFTETETRVTLTHADGSKTQTETIRNASNVVTSVVTVETSADGRVVRTEIDADGDGNLDQSNLIQTLVDGRTLAEFLTFASDGELTERLSSAASFDGLEVISQQDIDGDGLVDRLITRTLTKKADGSTAETVRTEIVSTEMLDGTMVAVTPIVSKVTETTVSADGRRTVSTVDVDADGEVDEVSTTVTRIDGAVETITTDNELARSVEPSLGDVVWASDLNEGAPIAATTISVVRADGLAKTVIADYDDDGVFEHREEWQTLIDGSRVASIVEVDEHGVQGASGTMTVSADGLTTSLTLDSYEGGDIDRVETSVTRADGSRVKTVVEYDNEDDSFLYKEVFTVSAGGQVVSHEIIGDASDNYLEGDDGDQTFDGAAGADEMAGGDGDDNYIIDNASDDVDEEVGEGTDTVSSSISHTLETNVENLTLTGSSATNGTGNDAGNEIAGNSAANVLSGGLGDDILKGGGGNDTLRGGADDDIYVFGLGGGVDTIDNEDIAGDEDTLVFGEGITPDDLLVSLVGDDLHIGFVGHSGDEVIVENWTDANNRVHEFVFEDETRITADQIGATSSGTAYHDEIYPAFAQTVGTPSQGLGVWYAYSDPTEGVIWLSDGPFNDSVTQSSISASQVAAGFSGVTGDWYGMQMEGRLVVSTAGQYTFTMTSEGDGSLKIHDAGGNEILGFEDDGGVEQESATLAAGVYYFETWHWTDGLPTTTFSIEWSGPGLSQQVISGSSLSYLDYESWSVGGAGVWTAGGEGVDSLIGTDLSDVLLGGDGHDYIWAGEGSDTLSGGAGDDVLYGADDNDRILGGSGDDYLNGEAGDDRLDGGAGADTMEGGDGSDTYVVDDAGDEVYDDGVTGTDTVESSVTHVLQANVENLTLTGTSAIDGTGNSLNNVITGNSAINTLTGGAGNDAYVVDNAGDVVVEGSSAGTDTIQSSASYTLSSNVENMTLTGSAAINATGNSLNNILTGNAATNTLDGGSGADEMIGGAGDDTYVVDNAGDDIDENSNEGTDTVQSSVAHTLEGDVENLTLTGTSSINGTGNGADNVITGNSGNNTLTGGDGDDTLDGGTGTDTMVGGSGHDTYVVNSSGDVVTEAAGAGTDTVQSSITYTLGSTLENLTLTGTAAINGTGNSQDNLIIGNSGANTLIGGSGEDILIGGDGNDTLKGGNDDDTYVFNLGDGVDTIDNEGISGDTDTLVFGAGIEIGDLLINQVGSDLHISIAGHSADEVIVKNWTTAASRIRSFTFEDGLSVRVDQVGATSSGTAYHDYIDPDFGQTVGTPHQGLGVWYATYSESTEETTWLSDVGYDDEVAQSSISAAQVANALSGVTADWYGAVLRGTLTVPADGEYTFTVTGEEWSFEIIDAGGNGVVYLEDYNGVEQVVVTLSAGSYFFQAAHWSEGTPTADFSVEWSGPGITQQVITGSALNYLDFEEWDAASEGVVVAGGAGSDGMWGTDSADVLLGGGGDDYLDGNGGADAMAGGSGNDTYRVDNVGDIVSENSNAGTDTVRSSISLTLASHVENLELDYEATAVNGTGNALDNKIVGNYLANTLNGGAGADTHFGGAGNDTYVVDNVGDEVAEESGEGTDTVQSSVSYTLGANIEHLTLTGSEDIDGTGNSLNNTITGNADSNVLDGGAGADTMVGGAGDDTYVVDNAGDVVTEGSSAGIDAVLSAITYTIGSNVENLTLTGASAINGTGNGSNNVIVGNSAANTITGNGGNDTLDGGAGADTMVGGNGDDVFVVDNASDVVTESSGSGTGNDTVLSSITHSLASNVENLTLTGTSAINGTGNSLNNVITGNSAVNTLTGGAGNDTYVVDNAGDVVVESSSAGTDTIQSSVTYTLSSNVEDLILTGSAAINGTGNSLNNDLTGNAANNTLDGGSGADEMIGGAGDDTYVVDNASDDIDENSGEGTDTVQSSIAHTLEGNVENLTLTGGSAINGTGNGLGNVITGNSANNTLTGGDGNDTLDGGTGTDTLVGGTGDDTYVVNSSGDVVTEGSGAGTDTVNSSITYTLGSNVENLTLTGTSAINGTGNSLENILVGNSGANTLTGNDNEDVLVGEGGADTLLGGNGEDILIGGAGNDTLTGGSGIDVFVFDVGFGHDTLTDYTASGANADYIGIDDDVFSTWAELIGAASQSGADVVITASAYDSITLKNTTVANLQQSNFQFS